MKWLWCLLVFSCSALAAVKSISPDANELASLPGYCKAKIGLQSDHPTTLYWKNVIGKDFVHIHHHCFALADLNRFYTSPHAGERQDYLNRAKNNIDYMMEHAGKQYPLWYDTYLLNAKIAHFDKRHDDALKSLQHALTYKPKDIRAQLLEVDIYTEIGEFTLAQAKLDEVKQLAPKLRTIKPRQDRIQALQTEQPHATNAQ
ncbi:hypothetical protein [Motilimonas sp. E26]|uniref:tetratricopeptide repeat protein n=1 Tax=Motilimonas TaxID=1914248 RepID=UPI001E300CA0|nr:hypothetical protein [Motilimonas sp. E26]MCE0556596.1 hypothetical protein [Motilimonas sp. E26]